VDRTSHVFNAKRNDQDSEVKLERMDYGHVFFLMFAHMYYVTVLYALLARVALTACCVSTVLVVVSVDGALGMFSVLVLDVLLLRRGMLGCVMFSPTDCVVLLF